MWERSSTVTWMAICGALAGWNFFEFSMSSQRMDSMACCDKPTCRLDVGWARKTEGLATPSSTHMDSARDSSVDRAKPSSDLAMDRAST